MNVWSGLLVVLAGLFGAAGVGAAAGAAHHVAGADLAIASQFLLIHAGVIAFLAASTARPRGAYLAAASILSLGLALFAGDLTIRAMGGAHLFFMAAPSGGTLMIVGWLAVALAGLLGILRPGH